MASNGTGVRAWHGLQAGPAPAGGFNQPFFSSALAAGARGSRPLPGRSPSRREYLRELGGDGCLELVEGAVARRLVVAPALEGGGVAEARALQVVECDLADEL